MSLLAASVFSALLLAGQTDTGAAIVGYVVDPSDAPVAEADVVFTAGPTRDGAVPILERTTTDASGRFQLVRPSVERLRGHVAPGSIWAYKPGHALANADLVRGDWGSRHRRGGNAATAWRSARVSRPRRLARPTGLPRSSQTQVSEVFVL
jgi:hypothetical protein